MEKYNNISKAMVSKIYKYNPRLWKKRTVIS